MEHFHVRKIKSLRWMSMNIDFISKTIWTLQNLHLRNDINSDIRRVFLIRHYFFKAHKRLREMYVINTWKKYGKIKSTRSWIFHPLSLFYHVRFKNARSIHHPSKGGGRYRAVSGVRQRRPKVLLVCRLDLFGEDHSKRDHMVAGGAGHYFLAGSLEREFGEREATTKRIRGYLGPTTKLPENCSTRLTRLFVFCFR